MEPRDVTDHEPDDLLERALDGGLSPDETRTLRARMASDAAFAARAAAHHELNGYMAGVQSADPPPGLLREVMRQVRAVRGEAAVAESRLAWWHDWFAPALLPRYAAVLVVGAVLGSAVFWAADRLGWDPAASRGASATIGPRATAADPPPSAFRDIDHPSARGRAEVHVSGTEIQVTVAVTPAGLVDVTVACGGTAPLGFAHSGEVSDLSMRDAVVSWRQERASRVVARFARAGTATTCTVTLDETRYSLEVLR